MAAPQAAQSGHALRALSLFAVLLTARAITLAGHAMPLTAWSPLAYLWQDVGVALAFFVLERVLNRAVAWGLYALLAAYTALNVPVALVLSTPMTWAMMRAARVPLADAVRHYVTAGTLLAITAPLAAGVAVLVALRGRRVPSGSWAIAAALAIVAMGPFAVNQIDTHGQHRNAVGTLIATSLRRVEPAAGTADWRASPFDHSRGDDLGALRGTMKGRNVILVILESTGARHLGIYGGTPDPTPNLTALARRSIVFERAYAVYPESIKGLYATLCSKYPAFDTPPETYVGVACASLPAALAAAGYRTALFHSGRFAYLGMPAIVGHRGFDLLEDAGAIGGQVNSSFGVDDASTVKRTLQWIGSLGKDQPFFLTYLPVAGHNPYEVTRPGPFAGKDDFTHYLNALHEGDEALGDLLSGLRTIGIEDQTLVIVTGDHGEAFGEHPGNFAHTMFINEENVRVPYVISGPGVTGGRVQRVASAIDTAPTILDLVGLPPPLLHQGRSLLEPEARMALFFTDYSIGWLGLADGCWKYLFEMDSGRSSLFDVCADPGESRNRAGEFPERISSYRTRVREWAADQKDVITRRR